MEKTMKIALEKMTTQEKLKLLEMIWEDLLKKENAIPSPDWHKEVLLKRESDLARGIEKITDWKEAKKDILKTIDEDKNS